MPIYEYQCKAGHEFEEIQSFSAPPYAKCPKCGKQAERMISLAAFHLKGSGWYSKDVAKSSAPPPSKETDAKEVKPAETTGTPEKTETKESKPEVAAPVEKKTPAKTSVSLSGRNRTARAKPARRKAKARR